MKNVDKFMIEDLFSLSYTEFCVRNLTAQALESELDDLIMYAQRYGASEHIEVLHLVAIRLCRQGDTGTNCTTGGILQPPSTGVIKKEPCAPFFIYKFVVCFCLHNTNTFAGFARSNKRLRLLWALRGLKSVFCPLWVFLTFIKGIITMLTSAIVSNNGTTSTATRTPAEYWMNSVICLYQRDGDNISIIQTYSNPDLNGTPLDSLFKVTGEINGTSMVSRVRNLLRQDNIEILSILKELKPGESKTTLTAPIEDEIAEAYGIQLEEGQHLAWGRSLYRKNKDAPISEQKPKVSLHRYF